jgi:hypothetical protein
MSDANNNANERTLRSLGKIITDPQGKDAVHIAVAPVVANQTLQPGQHVGFVESNAEAVGKSKQPIGIVDPFMRDAIHAGQRFWLFLYPGTITSLRHEWTHPAFGAVSATNDSDAEKAIRRIAEKMDIGYHSLMNGADEWLRTHDGKWGGDYVTEYGSEHWRDTFPALSAEFWRNYEIVRGVTVPDDRKESFFSCSC